METSYERGTYKDKIRMIRELVGKYLPTNYTYKINPGMFKTDDDGALRSANFDGFQIVIYKKIHDFGDISIRGGFVMGADLISKPEELESIIKGEIGALVYFIDNHVKVK